MAGTAVDAAIVEINAKLAEIAPQHEGLRDYSRLNLSEESHRIISESIEHYNRRVAYLITAKAALEALRVDGHPDLKPVEIAPESLAELQENASTIEAALKQFSSNAATSINLTGGDKSPKL